MQNKLGNLDNLSLGMGLTAHPNQRIPARYASLDGYGTADAGSKTKKTLGLLGSLLIIVIAYKLLSK